MLAKLTSLLWTRPKTMETSVIQLPPDLPNWLLVRELLQDLQGRLINENISDQETCWFMQTVYTTIQSERRWSGSRESHINRLKSQIHSSAQKKLDHSCIWFGLLKYLRKVSRDERDKFLYTVLPNIIKFAVAIENCRPVGSLQISRQQQGGSIKVSRQFVCSIVACFFLCLFPERKRESSKMNIVNFTAFFRHLPHSSQVAKLQCVLHYFECMMERDTWIQGDILLCRKVAPADWILTFDELRQCELKLCPLHVHTEGGIEDSGPDTLQVCFGNRTVGGGVLGRSAVQEEIMFSTCPELMAAMLFTEEMETNEAILVSGFQRFSSCSGFGDSLEFNGHYSGSDQVHTMVTIDAASYRDSPMCKQFEEASILRDLNKALIGFSWAPGTDGGRLQTWDVSRKYDESPGAVDMAADIVTSALTDALRQAAQSPVDPGTRQLSLHPLTLSSDQPQHEGLSCKSSTVPLQDADMENVSSAAESSAVTAEQNSSYSSLTFSGSLHTTKSESYASHQSSSSSSLAASTEVSILIERSLPSLPSCSPISTPSVTSSNFIPQISVHSSDSLLVHQHDLKGLTEGKCPGPTRHSSVVQDLTKFSPASDSVPGQASLNQTDLAGGAESTFTGSSNLSPSIRAHSEKLVCDVLGNFPRINVPSSAEEFVRPSKQQCVLCSTGQLEMPQVPIHPAGFPCSGDADDVKDIVIELPVTSTNDTAFCPALSHRESGKTESNDSKNVRSLSDEKFEDIVNSVDVVLSLPALQAEFERMSSGLSSSSLAVNFDSMSASANSVEDESIRQLNTEILYINVDRNVETWGLSRDKSDGRASSVDSVLLEPPLSSSPQSSISSANVSPNTSFLVSEPELPSRIRDVHAVADFFVPALDSLNGQARQSLRRESRDFYGELRDFLSSSSSGSRSSGSAGPLSSTASSSGSRSGSLSSHGTNGSTIDFPEFWSNFRRRSSQLSDTTSRRSSSSKHSSDFSTDLEEIAEGIQRHDHGVIEEEENMLSLVTDFASAFVSVAVRNGVTVAAQMNTSDRQHKVDHGDSLQLYTDKLNSEVGDLDQLKTGTEMLDNDGATRDLSPSTFSHQGGQSEGAVVADASLSSSLHSKGYHLIQPQAGRLSPARSTSKYLRSSGVHVPPSVASNSQESATISVQPSASHSIDSGFSSGMSSIALRSQCKTLESLNEETSLSSGVNISATNVEGLHSEVASDNARSSASIPACLFPRRLEFDESTAPTFDKTNIPLSPSKTLPVLAVLESKTVFLEAELKVPSVEQMQSDLANSERARIPLYPAQKEDELGLKECVDSKIHVTTGFTESVESKVHVSRKKSKHLKSLSAGPAVVGRHEQKHFRRQKAKDETSEDVDPWYQDTTCMVAETSLAVEAGASVCSSSQHKTTHSSSGAVETLKSSGIPKLKDKRMNYSESSIQARSKNLSSQKLSTEVVREKQKDIKKDRAVKEGSSSLTKLNTNKPLLKSHKSRYVFSDVAAPLADTRRSKTTPETCLKKQALKKQDEKRRRQRGDSARHDPFKLTKSQKFIRFVNSLAEISVSQGVLEGSEILFHKPTGPRSASDELYNWFASKIVAEVFVHVLGELGGHQSGEDVAVSQPQENDTVSDTDVFEPREDYAAGRLEVSGEEAAISKPKSILPAKSETQAPEPKESGQMKLYGSSKMVKFKDSQREYDSSLSLSQAQACTSIKTSAAPTFHRQNSSIPIASRRRSSLDLPLSSSSSPPGASGVASSKLHLKSVSPQQKPASVPSTSSLSNRDLSVDVFQTAAAIVSQVFQAVSDSLDVQAVSPVSSGRQGTLSSSDTAIHSTGSRINSTYDSVASNIFSSSSPKASDSPRRTRRSVSPSIGIFSKKPMSRETLTNAFLKVDSRPSFKTYERRSSEPCSTSVQLSLQAFNSIKFSQQAVEDKQRKISRTDDDIGRPRTWRRGSLDGFSFERRHSCGFKDPVLSRFAEELMKADTSVPELVIVGSRASSSSSGSRRSSVCAFKELSQANIDSELLNTSFTSVCSLPVSHSSRSQGRRVNMDRSRSRDSRNWKSDSSDTEYWFPPPKIVGAEFQQEYNRQHSQEELQDYASFFAGRVVQEAVCVLKCDPQYMSKEELDVELFAENLTDQILRDALIASIHGSHGSGQLAGDRGGGGDGRQNHSVPAEDCLVKGDNGDAKEKGYHAEGARPKTSLASLGTRPRTRSIPLRRDARRRDSELDYQRAEDRSDVDRQVSDQRMTRASTVGGYESIHSQQYLHVLPQVVTTNLGTSRHISVHDRKNTADYVSPSSQHKRHSSPGSCLQSSSLLSAYRPSAHAASGGHLIHSGTSQCEDYPSEKNTQKARSRVDSSSCAASSIPVYRGAAHSESSHLKKLPKASREASCASSASSISSYHSEHTGSSLPSSSGSEGIGPTGKDTPPRKQRAKRESESKNRTSQKSDSMKLSSTQKDRSRQRDSHGRRSDTGHPKRRPARQRGQHPDLSVEQRAAIDQFATSLSTTIVEDALLCCRGDRWMRFLSYHRPIATGNWGCGAFRGDAQLKLMIQWIAASVSRTPSLLYYTFSDERLDQAEEVVQVICGQTVGELAAALWDYCYWVRLNMTSPSSSSVSSSARQQRSHHTKMYSAWKEEQDSSLPQTLFDFLLEKFRKKGDR